jgi:hypothetical protein
MKSSYKKNLETLEIFKSKMLKNGWISNVIKNDREGKNGSISLEIKYQNSKFNFYFIQNISLSSVYEYVNYDFYILNEIVKNEKFTSYECLYGDYIDIIMYGIELFKDYSDILKTEKDKLLNEIKKIDVRIQKIKDLNLKNF